jgi:cell shape-determining protein MreC
MIDEDLLRPVRPPPRLVSESSRDSRRFRELCAKIEDNRTVLDRLRAENAALKNEVARCKAKVANYPNVKRQYDRLSRSLSQLAESRITSRGTRSGSKSPL